MDVFEDDGFRREHRNFGFVQHWHISSSEKILSHFLAVKG
jgi:hypothetical protein